MGDVQPWPDVRTVGVVLYPQFGLLDAAGPLHVLSAVSNVYQPVLLGPTAGPVPSGQTAAWLAEVAWEDAPATPMLIVPGGNGARAMLNDEPFMAFLGERVRAAHTVLAVASGVGLVAATGALDGRRATTSHRALAWCQSLAPRVRWQAAGRWVEDDGFFTASGASAGIDVALHVLSRQTADDVGENVARSLEHDWHRNAQHDPFAAGRWTART